MSDPGFLDELAWRGLLHQTTAEPAAIEAHLAGGVRTGYAGFDPTGDSLTIGNFIAIKMLMHFQRAGHRPIALVGGATGMIGDPSGKDSERQLMGLDEIAKNVEGCRRVLERFIDFDAGPRSAVVVDNAEWLSKLGYLEVLRDVGKHFSINAMIQRDSVRLRLEQREQGISYTEFSYMLLQAYDFVHLHRSMGCTVQMAGADQYGNIASGVDLIRRMGGGSGDGSEAYGITAPLVTKADGKKIGKTESGAVWLTADRTSPYAFYQYFVNTDDADVRGFLRRFTFLSRERIAELEAQQMEAPHERPAQKALAREMTELVHGPSELSRVLAATEALFGGDLRGLDRTTLAEVFADVPHSEHAKQLLDGEGLALAELLPSTTLASSKREARQFLSTGAVSVNGQKADADRRLTSADLLHGESILLRRGKKHWHATRWK